MLEGFAQGAPFFTIPVSWVLHICALGALVWVARAFGGGVPTLLNGQYVISNHGRVLRELSRAQYLNAEGLMLRCTIILFLPVYWIAFTFWCLGKGRSQGASQLHPIT